MATLAAPFAVWWVVDHYLRRRWNQPGFREVLKQSRDLAGIVAASVAWALMLLMAIIGGVDAVWWFVSACLRFG